MGGSHKNVEEMMKRLLDNGYAVVSVGYRFLPDALLDEISSDVTKAFEFVRKNDKQYGLDSNRIKPHLSGFQRHATDFDVSRQQ